ncbi:MAG: HK97 gp10 family phage protein [Ammonifex sp.]|jgi:hypothetical protein|nr:MAG: HK97 gp10 family phage protein [Ammonifex sp.]
MTLKWRGDLAKKIAREAAMQALHDGAEAILTEAIDEAPIDTGTLRRSGAVTDAPTEGAVYVSFSTPYAVKQHEDLTLNHPRGGKAKYLEDPFKRNAAKVEKLVGLRVKKALKDAR